MSLFQKRIANYLFAATVTAGLSGGSVCFADKSEPEYGGTVRVAINSDIRSTNPGVHRDGNTDMVLYHIGEGLVAFREDITPGPLLAESIHISADGLIYDFPLRRGVKFHNGAEMTSDDVVWSWQRLLGKNTGYRCLPDFDGTGPTGLKITSVSAEGPYQVRFTLNQPSSMFLYRMASIQCLAAIMHPDSVAPDGSWNRPLATGPYQLEAWERGQHVSLTRFEDYQSRPEPKDGLTGAKVAFFDRIIFQIVPDRIAAKSSVYAGNMDLVYALPLSTAKEVEKRASVQKDVKVYHQETLDWTALLIQTKDPLMADVRMRKAIAHAISQDMIATFSTFDYARSNPSAVQSVSRYHADVPDIWPDYNPEKARKLAQEAGYKGEVISIQANSKFSYMYDNAVAIQAMLNAAGFNARIDMYDWATQLTNFFKGNFQLSSFGYSAQSHPALMFDNIIGIKSKRATAQWDSEAAFALLTALENAAEGLEMQHLLNELHQLMAEEVPIVGLYNDHIVDVSAADIEGYQPWPFGRPRLWGVWRKHTGDTK